jgi:hypothetical protein
MQLGFQLMNNHQAGIVDSRVDCNEQGIKPETYQGYRKQVFHKTTKDLEWIQDPSPLHVFPRQVLYMHSPLCLVQPWRGYLRYLSTCDLVFRTCV